MNTETLDRLFLEWSQFTEAKTARDLANERRITEQAEWIRALRTFAQHRPRCRWRDGAGAGRCDCGLSGLMEKTKGQP
jgi:hypothetical protein